MPEPNKRVVVTGLKAAERQFAAYVRLRLATERSTGGLLRSVQALKTAAEKARRDAEAEKARKQ